MPVALKQAKAEEQLLNEEMYRAARPRIVDFIRRLHQARTAEDFYRLHLDVLKEFLARQIAVSETVPIFRAQTAAEIAQLAAAATKPLEELQVMTGRLDRAKRQERVASGLQHALRVVADGIAWKALDYNRAAITVLGRGLRVGRLATGPGFDTEYAAIRMYWEQHRLFAIHNDITNCLRHGDLTIINFSSPKEINFAEVKVKNLASGREQMRRIDEVVDLLRTGVAQRGATGLPARILHVPGPYETFLPELGTLIARARTERVAWSRPHPAFVVAAVDYSVPDLGRLELAQVEIKRTLRWKEPARGFIWTGAERRLRDRGATPSNFAPLSIYPFPAEDVADLILGFVDTVVYVDIDQLEASFGAEGLRAVVDRTPRATRFLRAADDRVAVSVPAHEREAMLNELVHPRTAARAVKALIGYTQNSGAAQEQILLAFADESGTWA